jgi:hypothetical protein
MEGSWNCIREVDGSWNYIRDAEYSGGKKELHQDSLGIFKGRN